MGTTTKFAFLYTGRSFLPSHLIIIAAVNLFGKLMIELYQENNNALFKKPLSQFHMNSENYIFTYLHSDFRHDLQNFMFHVYFGGVRLVYSSYI